MKFELPDWLVDIPFNEYYSILTACKNAASKAFYKKLEQIHDERLISEAHDRSGQMNIYDYV
jgi:hypothetical protein